jgi:hypothetical protein
VEDEVGLGSGVAVGGSVGVSRGGCALAVGSRVGLGAGVEVGGSVGVSRGGCALAVGGGVGLGASVEVGGGVGVTAGSTVGVGGTSEAVGGPASPQAATNRPIAPTSTSLKRTMSLPPQVARAPRPTLTQPSPSPGEGIRPPLPGGERAGVRGGRADVPIACFRAESAAGVAHVRVQGLADRCAVAHSSLHSSSFELVARPDPTLTPTLPLRGGGSQKTVISPPAGARAP